MLTERDDCMSVFQAAILGILQGLAEFIPVSSSGHLELARRIMGLTETDGVMTLLTVLLHAGTLIAIIVVFWPDWMDILQKAVVKSKAFWLLVLASVPALLAALGLKALGWEENKGFLGVAFLVTGVFLALVEKISHRGRHMKTSRQVAPPNALAMGCMQALAMLPGISRSGSTILGGVASGLDKKTAVKFSFMMSAPAVLGSLLLEGKDALETGAFDFLSGNLGPIAVGVVLAAVVGYLTIRFMLRLITRVSFRWFALYLFVLGATVIILQIAGIGGLPPIAAPFSPVP